MTQSHLIANRIREVLLSGTWIANTNYQHQLSTVSWQQATHKVDGLNTIAALTFHVNYYLVGLLNVFNGGKLNISDSLSFTMPPINSQADWHHLTNELLSNAEKFAQAVERMDDHTLHLPFVEQKYGTNLRNIEAIIEHSYYHLGQISLLHKMVQGNHLP